VDRDGPEKKKGRAKSRPLTRGGEGFYCWKKVQFPLLNRGTLNMAKIGGSVARDFGKKEGKSAMRGKGA